jgi:integrase
MGRQTKSGKPRMFPFSLAPELKALLVAQWAARDGVCVFHRDGRRIGDFRKVWATACAKAGAVGRLVHDLRRTAARDYRRAGLSEGEIMRLCGWETRDMFDRYNIIDEQDLAAAVAKRFQVGTGIAPSTANGIAAMVTPS